MDLQINAKCEDPTVSQLAGTGIAITPPVGEDYWLFRVPLSDKQAIVGFPKLLTIGIGFQVEEDWNTNLPYSYDATEIFNHISHNKGDDSISDQYCIEAIQLVKDVATKYKEMANQSLNADLVNSAG
jgi:hypothetical protein